MSVPLFRRIVARVRRPVLYGLDRLSFAQRRDFTRNPLARRLFERRTPDLSAAARHVVAQLEKSGWAKIDFFDLFGRDRESEDLLNELQEVARDFVQDPGTQSRIREYLESPGPSLAGKAYIRRLADPERGPLRLAPTHPLVRFIASPFVLDVVNSYLGLFCKVQTMDLWYTIASSRKRARVASQNWHRDRDDERLVKIFLFLSDVDDDSGPTEYIPETRKGGRYASLCPTVSGNLPGHLVYPDPDKVAGSVAADDIVRCVGPRGTLYFLDTANLHRGGFTQTKERLFAHWICVSPASLQSKARFVLEGLPPRGLTSAASYAFDTTGTLDTLRDY